MSTEMWRATASHHLMRSALTHNPRSEGVRPAGFEPETRGLEERATGLRRVTEVYAGPSPFRAESPSLRGIPGDSASDQVERTDPPVIGVE